MRISSPLLNSHSHSYPWLTTLKASQLRRIAQATGIQTLGTKASLIARLRDELPESSREPEPEKQMRTCKNTDTGTGTGMSILSIDMGIQNLAYAHLLVSRDTPTATATGAAPASASVTVKLNAWRRLAVSEALVGVTDSPSTSSSPGKSKGEVKEKVTSKHTFSPPEYARTAYTLVNNLLHRYQPSHVLIERQRFRSGGGSAVQEWTLRVGVFEGMLYAVLYALGCERQRERLLQGAEGRPGPAVLGVEPRRVGAYWEDRLGLGSGLGSMSEGRGKGKKASKEGKKVKINLAGEWLRAGVITGGGDSPVRLSVADDPELRALVDAYLRRWAGKSNPKTSVSKVKAEAGGQGRGVAEDDGAVIEPPDVRKMDDLADCLVQGVTWLEWQAMRQRISTEGLDAVLRLENGKL